MMTFRHIPAWLGLATLALSSSAESQLLEDVPEQLEGVGIDVLSDVALPLDLTFQDESGETKALGTFFQEGRPVALNFVYFDCPMLCNVFLDGFTGSLRDLDWTPGEEFEVISISIDPQDTPAGAAAKRDKYVESLGREGAENGWHFLTGPEENIQQLAAACGFKYRLEPSTGEYMHSAGIFLATPKGRLSRTLTGVTFDPQTLRLSLVEASNGRIGSPLDQVMLFCFAYDHTAGRYGPAAFKLMRAFAALTVVVLGVFLMVSLKRDFRRRSALTMGAGS